MRGYRCGRGHGRGQLERWVRRKAQAEVKLGGSTIFVVLSHAEDDWPFAVENDSDHAFTFYQTVNLKIDGKV